MSIPGRLCRNRRDDLLKEAAADEAVQQRADYYIQLREPFELSDQASPFRCRPWRGQSTYQLDLRDTLRFFPRDVRLDWIFGDNILDPPTPSLVKSRPIASENRNGVLTKLNRIRHFQFVEDPTPFTEKKDMLVWRGNASQPHRRAFLDRFFSHPLCDVGHYYQRPVENMPYGKEILSIPEQLQYKFVFAMEGNDVATNLKWILSSRSLCIMPPCRYETWFMEGRLQAGVHYVEVAPDISDLEDKLSYYRTHPDEAEAIIQNANAWVNQFQNPHRERLISLEVLARYLRLAGQV